MSNEIPTVFVVDDDPSVRKALERLITTMGFRAQTFESAQSFLNLTPGRGPGCLILDIRMPAMSGLELQNELASRGWEIPIIFLTGHGTVPMTARAMKAGAFDFLEKPIDDQKLLEAIHQALEKEKNSALEKEERRKIQQRLDRLSPREYEVFKSLLSGRLNKQTAHELGISEKTVKVHRSRVMEKTQAASLADLIWMAQKARVVPD
jgi:RNA polymerase sigma factor (sigma-70 family)